MYEALVILDHNLAISRKRC